MPRSITPDHPNLQLAVGRLRRIQYTWAALLVGMALLTVLSRPAVVPIHWLTGALLLVLGPQPALLGMVAVLWGLSLLGLIPEVNQALALDPIGALFGVELIESLALSFVRLVLLIMAWGQLLFYRLLYGAPSLGPETPEIPAVVDNHTDRLAGWSQAAGWTGLLVLLVGLLTATTPQMLSTSMGLASLAVGLGVGVAFSPTSRRAVALASVVLGGMLFVLNVALLST